uniref:Uncharacterized protein n=1 Tax=Daphnia magna TaxID=35525 RepID=A0A0P6FUT2_9CRUS
MVTRRHVRNPTRNLDLCSVLLDKRGVARNTIWPMKSEVRLLNAICQDRRILAVVVYFLKWYTNDVLLGALTPFGKFPIGLGCSCS